MESNERVEKFVREAITDISGIVDIDVDTNLLNSELAIPPANFLYLFDIFEREHGTKVYDILINSSFNVMTIRMLTNAINALIISVS